MSDTNIHLKLSEPGASLVQDAAMNEYLGCYGFPQPPHVRFGFFRFPSPQANDRVSLLGQAWLPSHAQGTILLVHGFSEHTGNYAKLIEDFTNARYAVIMMDLRGHGLSEGPRGHVGTPVTYAEDLEMFFEHSFGHIIPNRPLYIWGHSLGALTALQFIHRKKISITPKAVVLSSPFLGFPELSGAQKILTFFAPLMAKILPTLPISHNISSQVLSHDEAYLARRYEDPLISSVASPKWFISTRESIQNIHKVAKDFQNLAPTLLLLAGDEMVTNLNEARRFAFAAYAGMKHKVIEFPGYYHELEKEPDIRDRIVSESISWFNSH